MGKKQGTKACTKCSKRKSLSNFSFRDKNKGYRQAVCKACTNIYNHKWQKKNSVRLKLVKKKYRKEHPDAHRRWRYKQLGFTIADYEKLLKSQKGCCAICGKHQSKSKRMLALDHNHTTDRVRGILCDTCNRYFGWYEKHQKEITNYWDRDWR